jgi:predicted ATPase/class 3 adenylate cyclase
VLRLIEALADPDRPLLLFLDDLQWADPGTLAVLEGLFEEPGRGGLIVVGAWRDNEVGAEHPLRKALKAIQHGDSVDLHLNPLLVRDVRQLLADALERGSTEVKELAEHLHQASGGNPFFLTQLLESVHRAGLLTRGAGGWEWRLPQIVAHPMGDDVGQLMAARLGELIAPTRDAMRVAAVLGADLDFRALVAAREAAPRALLAAVDEASAAGLLHLEGAGWTLLRSAGADDSVPLDGMRLRFVHDAVQAGAYDLTPVAERPALHLRVARLLRPDLRDDAEKLLTVVEHYGYAAHLIEVADERLDVAILHARAGARALESAAFEAARSFFVGGRALLGGDWPDIAWKLVAGECRTATLLGDFEAAGAALEVLREHIAAPEQRFDVYGLDMALSHHQGNLGGVVETGLEALEALGAGMPRFPSQAQIGEAFAALEGALQGRDLATVTQGEWTGDPVEHAVQRFLFAIGPCAYLTQQSALWQTICLTLSRRSLTHGLTPTSAYGFSGLAMLLAGGLAQHERARAFGDAALAIADASGSRAMQATARFMVGGFVVHWTRPYPEAVALVDRGHQDALLAGDVIYASWCLASGAITTTLAGVSLDDAVARAERMEAHATRHGLEDNAMFLPALRQFARALQGRTNGPATMDDGTFTEQGFVRSMEGRFFRVPLHVFQVLRAWLRLLEGDVSGAQDALTAAEQVVGTSFSMPILAEHAALQALVHAAACDSPQGEIWDELQTGRETLATQAAAGPRVYTPRLLLVEAEIARIEGDLAKALGRYEAAMDAALSLGSHLWAAVIAEHAARALERGGSPRAARPWRLDAAHAWLRLGARTRAEALGFDGAGSAETSRGRSLVTSSVRADVALDMETALKAARSIAAELDLDALLARLSHLALENAGAETAWLLLETGDGLRVVSRSEGSGRFVRLDEPFEGSGAPSASVVRLVIGSRAPIVVEDARTDPRFASVPELQERGVRSLMAVPLIHQGRMAGVLVLENNLASGVFTPHRLELLRMLSSQIAVALENARLVEDLRELNTAYARFVPQAFLRFLGKRAITDVRLGDAVEAEMTVLFTDIRSFTTLSEGRSPAENFEFINGYLRAIGPTIRNHGGFIDKYIGDGIMALFPGAAEDAVRAAIAIRKALRSFNEELGRKGQDPIAIGIGLHRGRLMLGTIGEAERMDGTVISDVVNTASRVEGLTKRFACTCLMTGAVTDALPGRDSFLTRYLGQVPVKGRSGHVTIFELFDGDPRELRQAKWATRADFEAAVRAFENGDVTASGAFEALLDELPGDRVLERLMAEAGERAGHG